MNHPREALSAYLDDELSGEERSQLEQHLRDCTPCTALLADLELLARAGAEEQVPPAPTDMSARIMAHIPRGVVERRRHWIYRMPLAAAASLAAVAVLWVVFQSAPAPLSDPEFGRDIASGESLLLTTEESQPPQGAAEGAGSTSATEETTRQGAKKSELNEKAEAPSSAQETARRFAPAPSDEDGASIGNKEDAPTATAVPEVRKPKPVDRADRLEKEKQRLAGRPEPIAPPAKSSRERALALQAVADSTREADDAAVPRAAATALGSVAKQNVPMEESLVAADNNLLSTSPPTLVLREAGQEIRLTDTGQLTVRAPEYDCTILLLAGAEDAESPAGERILQRSFADSRDLPVEEEILSLFQDGLVGGELADQKRKVQHAPARDAVGRLEPPSWTLVLERAEGARPMESDARAADIRSRLQSLVQERYRPRLEAQCGPLPQPAEEEGRKP